MRDLAAQVTSSLLRFPEVTVDALGEDEIKLDSVLLGKFATGRNGLAWLACGPQLEVVSSTTGERLSAYHFSGVGENPPNVLAAREFSWLKRSGLLVGLEEAEGSMLCLYDLGISRVVKAVVVPGRITAIEPLISYGGASASTQHLHQSLRWFFGIAAVVTDVGHVLLIDLCLDDLSCSQSELEASDLQVINNSPTEIPRLRESVTSQGRHLCLQIHFPRGTSATALQFIPRTNQLAVGFSDGYLQLWNMKTLKKEYHSQLEGGRVPVYAFTFQEPENDPRNCCYLWAVQSSQDSEGDVVSLHLLQLAFGERKCLASGKILYEGLEYCEERYSQDLNGEAFALRTQATSTRLLGCQTIEKFRNHPDRDDSMNEVASPDTSVSIFSWQVKSYGQGKPSTYVGVFDINRWYHAQMPDSLRMGEFLHSCSYFALWSLDSVVAMTSPCPLLDVLVHERSLSRGLPPTCPPPEQFFNPTTYNFDATCLLNSGIVHLTCSGYQKETLSFLKKSGPSLSEVIPDGYNRCLMSGLLSSRLTDVQPSSLTQEEQLEAILSTAVETSTLGLITGCIRQWTSEEQPRSAANLRFILEWAWSKVVLTKEELDRICAPLFDSSCNFIDPQTLQLLQHCQLLLSNLSTILNCFLSEAQELTEKGLVGLVNKNVVSSLISQYARVVLWFCRSGLLPEGSDENVLQISRPFYNYPIIQNYYTSRREKLERLSRGKWCADCLLIDGLVSQCGDRIANLWKRDEGGTGQYPPPTLHALLDIFLLDTVEETSKHAIVIYLLLDVMYSFPNKSESSVESFPTAFAIPVGLVKLVQGFWLLDHNDHENSLDLLLHPATSRAMLSWQHARVIQALMCQGEHRRALRYIQMMKPATSSSSEIKLYLTVLLHNRCMVEAWALLRQHSNKLNVEELLRCMYEMCQSMGLMEELLKLPLALPEQECLEKFLQSSAGLQNQEFLMVHYLQQANYVPALQLNQALKMNLVNDRDPKIKERTNARNSILDQYGKVLPRVQRRLATERAKPYQLPSTILREVARPQPLSTVAKPAPAGNVLTRASFINNVLSKIGEVWLGKTVTPEPSPLKSLRVPELPSFTPRRQSVELPDAFVGTPITRTSKTISRILDLVVRPTTEKMPEAFSFQQTPPKQGRSWPASSPLQTSAVKASGLKNISKASELCLLQTPQVVKRARALTSTGPSFPGFTPQSILRTSQRPTPVGSPSASPGHSLTPPLRVKESRITFIEERTPKTSRGSNGIAADREINFLSTASPTLKSQPPGSWAVPAAVEDEEEEKEMVEEGGMAMEGSRPHETSQASARSADSTLEFHDAPTPEELEEEVVTLNPKLAALEHPSSAVVKASERVTPTEMQEEVLTEEEEEEQPMEQTGSDIVEQNTFSLDILSTLTRSGIRETSGAEFSLTSFTTSETVSQVTEEPLCPALAERPALETQTSEASEPDAVDSHSVVSVDDSEDSSSTESETKLEASAELDPDSEVEILEEVCGNPREQRPSPPHLFLEEQPIPELEYMEEHPAAVLPVLAHEAVEEEEDLEVEALEEEPVSFTELQPSAPLLIPVEFSEEPELDGDLLQLDHPNAFEPMVDHEDHAAPSNFTLMLEAEDGENGLADSVLEDEHLLIVELPPSAENRTGDQNGASERVEEEEVISQEEITPEGVVDKERPEPVPETLPYVPEPIKMAIAENLLDAIKDTRSKEFAAELLESSVQPEVLVTGRKTTSLTTTTMTSESVRETIHMGCGDALVEEMRRTRGASMLVAEVPISSDQPEAEEVKQQQEEAAVKDLPAPAPSQKIDEEETLLAQMDLPVPTTPKRAGRRRKNTLDSTFPVTPRRSTRNTRDAESDEALENPEAPINSKLQTPQKSTPHKGGRRAKNAVVVEPPEDVQERDGLNDQDIPMPVTPTRRRGRPSVPCVSESAPMVPDEMALDQSEKKVPSSPSRLTRKSVTLEIPHLAKTEEKDTEIAEQETLIPRKRGRKPKNLVAAEQAKTVQSEPPRTPGRTTRSRLALVVEVPEKELPPLPEILPQDEPGLPVAEDALKNRLEEETRGEGEEAMALLVEGEVSIRDNFQDDTGADQRLSEATDNTRGPSSPTAGPSDEPPTETEVTEAAAGTAKDAPKSRKPGRRARPSRLPPPAKESFIFSPPRTRSKKTRAKKSPDSPEAPPDSQPQFVFSPPTTRTRRKMGQEISRNITEDMEQQEVQDEVPKVSEETDTRAAKPRKKRAARAPKKAVWSPPPVEVNLISPMPSPEELPRGRRKKPEEAESPLQRMNLRRNRKRLMDTIFPKPVTRRKML